MPLGKVTVGTTATVVRATEERKQIVVSNLSSSTPIYFSIDGSTPTAPSGANPGIPLGPGERYVCNEGDRRSVVCNGGITAITASGTADVGWSVML